MAASTTLAFARRGLCLLLWLPLLMAGCASAPPAPLPVGTLVLGQVAHVATKDEMARGVTVDDQPLLVPPYLLQRCALDARSLEDGDLAVLRVFVFWMSRVPQSSLWWVTVPRGSVVAPDDFVEVELKSGRDDQRCPVIVRVRASSTSIGECRFARNERTGSGAVLGSIAGALQAVATGGGPPGSMSIYCKGLEDDGWAKHAAGPYEAIVWRKAPP